MGNPNAGKTSAFNALTGSSQKVSNYPGVTVERAEGLLDLPGLGTVEVIDLPGLYTTTALSTDEEVAMQVLRGEAGERKPDAVICVMDAGNLERSLFFYSHIADLGLPTIAALTHMDTLRRHSEDIDLEALSENVLRVPCIAVVPHKGEGVQALKEQIEKTLLNPSPANPVGRELGSTTLLTTDERYDWASQAKQQIFRSEKPRERSSTDRIDQILTHRVFGAGIFVAIMYVVFQSIYTFAAPLMDGIESAFKWLGDLVSARLSGTPWLESLIVDGLLNGVGTVVMFLPQILILFLFIAILEGSGYLARAAFMMDRLLGWCGLSGRAFVPLLSSFACAIPGIMAARVMPDARSRLATILVAPLMSCSARLPVYVLLIGAFIEPQFGPAWAGFALFAVHFVGLIVAIPVVLALNRRILKGKRLPFVLELPRYQWPKWRDVWLSMYLRGTTFVQTAGTIIVLMSMLMWVLLYFPRSEARDQSYRAEYAQLSEVRRQKVSEENFLENRRTEESYLGRFGKAIEPVFAPAGFDWRISTAILSAFPAREVVVSSMSILFSLGSEAEEADLRGALKEATWPDGRPLFTGWTAVGLMVFFALCCQCMATLATVRRETGTWKWPVFMFVYMTGLAYIAAVGIHWLSRFF